MPSIITDSFCFHLFLIATAILVVVANPTDRTLDESSEDLCEVEASGNFQLDIRSLQNKVYCRYKVCDDKHGNKNGKTRNPDVIHSIVCEKSPYCYQVYLTVEAEIGRAHV
jgi:hypothetical protein